MVGDQRDDQDELGLKPPKFDNAVIDTDQDDAEQGGQNGANRHDCEQFSLHRGESLPADRVFGFCVVNEQPGQIKQPREPGHHEGDMDGHEDRVIITEGTHWH